MMQPAGAGGMSQAPMDPQQMAPQQQQPQQHQMAPPPMAPQQWGMMPPQMAPQPQYQQVPQPPPMWAQQQSQIPPPMPMQYQHIQPQFPYAAPAPAPAPAAAPAPAPAQQPGSDEVRTLWIGDLQPWMDETYITGLFSQVGEVYSVKLIRNRLTQQLDGYGFIEFASHAIAEQVLTTYNGQLIPGQEQAFRLNWASKSAGERRGDDGPDYTIFVGDLAPDVTDFQLQEMFKGYPSIKGAKVVTDRATARSKGYGFVRFADPNDQTRAMTEMNGVYCSTRPMRIGPAATKKDAGSQQAYPTKAPYQSAQGTQSENDPNNTTIFVGGLDPNVSEDHLRQLFSQYGELVHVKIPIGKRCGFVQFAVRAKAEEALMMLNGTLLGGQHIRLSWGRSPSVKQQQQDPNQQNGNYYGYGQGYEAYGYAQPPQDPNMYAYGGYPTYGNYQQQQ